MLTRVLVLFCVFFSGCTSLRLYPVCFFDDEAPDPAVKVQHIEKLTSVLQKFDNLAFATYDGRWVVAKTSKVMHREIEKLWPPLACIGTVTSGTEVKSNADCVQFVADQLKSEDFLSFDINDKNIALSDEALGPSNVICWRSFPPPAKPAM